MDRYAVIGISVIALGAGCAGDDTDLLDGEDDTLADGKADVAGIADKTPVACAILRAAREASFSVLDHDAGLNRKAVEHIVAARSKRFLGTIAALDAVKYVGPHAFTALRNFAAGNPSFACATVDVQLLGMNDFHGNLHPPSGSSGRIVIGPDPNVDRVDAGGAEFLATHVARLRAENPNTVVVAAGDIIGATPLMSALFHDEPSIESMNALGLQIAAVGNHEFDEGIVELWRMQYGGCHPQDGCQDGDPFDGAAFQYLAANVTDVATGETVFPPYVTRVFGAAQVAFIGMTLENTPSVTTAAGVAGLAFHDEVATVNALVPKLRAEGIETIVVLLHEGGAVTGLYNECVGASGPVFEIARDLHPAVDVVVAGHTNAAHVCTIAGKLVTSAASFGRLVTDIDLTIDEVTGDVMTKTASNVIVTRTVTKDPAQTSLIAKYERLAAPLANRVIGRASADLLRAQDASGQSTLGHVIADAQLAATASAGAVIALMNPGGIRTDILASMVSGTEQHGEITYGEAFAVQPFGNTLTTVTLTGAQLDALLEQQWAIVGGAERAMILSVSKGLTYSWDGRRAIGDRVSNLRLDGVAISPTASYRVTANSFLADGGDGFSQFALGTQRASGPIDVDAFEAHLRAAGTLVVPALDRITRLD